jgi:hypothetical protein
MSQLGDVSAFSSISVSASYSVSAYTTYLMYALVIQRHKIDQYVFEQVRAGIEAETQFLYMPSVYAGRDSLTFALKAYIKCLATLALSQASSATP